MDYENLPCSGQGPGMYGCDRDIFERVWRRVMPEETPSCPICLKNTPAEAEMMPGIFNMANAPMPAASTPTNTTVPAASAQPFTTMPAISNNSATPMGSSMVPMQTTEEMPSATGSDFPSENDVPYFGSASAIHGSQMQEFILRALQGWRYYQLLSHRSSSAMKKLYSVMAAEKRQQAKRLSTAYFLITGINFFPIERITTPPFNSYLGMLRNRFTAEQRETADYLASAEEIDDPWLHDLYIDLAHESTQLAGDIRRSLEQM